MINARLCMLLVCPDNVGTTLSYYFEGNNVVYNNGMQKMLRLRRAPKRESGMDARFIVNYGICGVRFCIDLLEVTRHLF